MISTSVRRVLTSVGLSYRGECKQEFGQLIDDLSVHSILHGPATRLGTIIRIIWRARAARARGGRELAADGGDDE